jgi:hypothetical protein
MFCRRHSARLRVLVCVVLSEFFKGVGQSTETEYVQPHCIFDFHINIVTDKDVLRCASDEGVKQSEIRKRLLEEAKQNVDIQMNSIKDCWTTKKRKK